MKISEWQYSRNQLRHWICDGILYEDGKKGKSGHKLFEIKTSRNQYEYRKPTDIYRLLHKGKFIVAHKRVNVLKQLARKILENKNA